MRFHDRPGTDGDLSQALALMTEALAILDRLEAPGEIGSTLDLAICRLAALLRKQEHASSGVRSLLEHLEGELSRAGLYEPAAPFPWENR